MDEPAHVEFYRSKDGSITLEVRSDAETVWLTRLQMAALFGRDVKTIGKHLSNARREELDGIPVVAKYATTATDGKTYQVEHYNLDAVLSIGYRVKSPEGIHFRRWANETLKRYVIEGAALNERRLEQLGSIVRVLARSSDQLVSGVADVLAGYLPGLTALRDYDEGTITSPTGDAPSWVLSYGEARSVIAQVGAEFSDDQLFGRERGDALKGVVAAIYQTFGGQQLYPTVQDQAANLLYLVVKDHPLSDGNKRSAAALFVHFLSKNGTLIDHRGLPRITNNALAAITLMVAMSDPKEKDLMVALVIRMLSDEP
ncbi:RhuM family protein [Agromyces sp. NPDC049794]|uniref:RhuM family protein n=1 Tax=unclassified Agromyces TaxID=2639701 RepID=UPI0033F9A10E